MNEIIHLCLVSRQAMPNIIPALLYNPQKVVLITTKEEINTAKNISKVLHKYNIDCDLHNDLVSAYDLNSVSNAINKIIELNKGEILTLNLTGGTKLMAIAAYELFRNHDMNIIYCDTYDESIIHFKKGKFEVEKYNGIRISVENYLIAYGFKPNNAQNKSKRFESIGLIKFISNNLNEYTKFSNAIRNSSNNYPQNFKLIRNKEEIILRYKQIQIFKSKKGNYQYLIGYWLEDLIFYLIRSKFPNIDIEKNYNILSKSDSPNEIDIIFTKNGKLYLISCKTGKFNKMHLFELEGLRNLAGGTFGKAYLVTISNVSKPIQERANEMNIKALNIFDFMKEVF